MRKYDREEDLHNTGLEQQLGEKLRRTKELSKNELSRIIEWKFQGRLLGRRKRILQLISIVPDDFIRKVSSESFSEEDEGTRIRKLLGRYGGINGVGPAIASVILTFYEPHSYGIFDIHAWRELMGKQPQDLFTLDNLLRFLTRLREEASRLNLDARDAEKAYFKKNFDESTGLHSTSQSLNASECPRCGSPLVWRESRKGERYQGCTNYRGGCRWNDRSF